MPTDDKKVKVILDTNALLMPFQFKINLNLELSRILGECEIIVLTSVLHELKKLAARGDRHAKEALSLSRRFKIIESSGPVDDAVVKMAEETGAVVVTNDIKLRSRLKSNGIKVLFLREKTHLVEG